VRVSWPSVNCRLRSQKSISLEKVFIKAPDRVLPTLIPHGSGVGLIALALLAGRREIAENRRFCTTLTQSRGRLCLRARKARALFTGCPATMSSTKCSPSMDPEAFAELLSQCWPAEREFASRAGHGR